MDHTNQIVELFVGYSYLDKDNHQIKANCSSTLVKGESKLILFDTLTPWDCEVLLKELKRHHAKPEDINYVVCSHGHSDHIGNLNLFLNAEHFVGSCRSFKHIYYCHDFDEKPYMLDKNIEVISTPGHTAACVSLIVRNTNLGHHASIALVGDLFEREEDIFDESIWIAAGSEMESAQRKNRSMIADMVDFICPGHGPHFKVTDEMREKLRDDVELD